LKTTLQGKNTVLRAKLENLCLETSFTDFYLKKKRNFSGAGSYQKTISSSSDTGYNHKY